jgi:hypothetical protein
MIDYSEYKRMENLVSKLFSNKRHELFLIKQHLVDKLANISVTGNNSLCGPVELAARRTLNQLSRAESTIVRRHESSKALAYDVNIKIANKMHFKTLLVSSE